MFVETKKSSIQFVCGALDERQTEVLTVTPFLDGFSLASLVGEFERTQGYEPPNGYGGIIPEWFRYGPLEDYFLGHHPEGSNWARLGGAWVLGCE
jgi:hypothetical protein